MTLLIAFLQIVTTYFLFLMSSGLIASILFSGSGSIDTGYGPALSAIIAVFGVGWLSGRIRGGIHAEKMGMRFSGTFIGAMIGMFILMITVSGFAGILIPPLLATIGYHLAQRFN